MYPDLLGIFGIQLYGVLFERVLWILGVALMLWGEVSSIQLIRGGKKSEGLIQGSIVTAILIWLGIRLYGTFQTDYTLLFKSPLVLHSYAFMILVGIVLGTVSAMKMAPQMGYKSRDIGRLCLWMVLFGFIGARAAHVIVDAGTYWNSCFAPETVGLAKRNCLRWADVSEGGLTFYGGVIAGMAVLITFYIKHRKENARVLSIADVLSPALAMAHGCGRIGCLAAGCCWGAITTGHLGIHYGPDSFAFAELAKNPAYAEILKTGQTPLMHATQLYEAFGEFALFGVLCILFTKKARMGTMIATWLIGYGVMRFIVEIMRDDAERGHFFESVHPTINSIFHVAPDHVTFLSTSQGIAIGMILLGIIAFIASRFSKARASSQ